MWMRNNYLFKRVIEDNSNKNPPNYILISHDQLLLKVAPYGSAYIFGHFSDTTTLMNISYIFQVDMTIEQHWNILRLFLTMCLLP